MLVYLIGTEQAWFDTVRAPSQTRDASDAAGHRCP